jgi:transcriptional regulator with XRE-family HTH domain
MSKGNGTSHTEPKIGQTLELARKERGLSLHQVEQETKIRARYLRELERENFDVLPPVYVQGSLKTYANFLGLDGEALTRELRRRQPPEDEPEAQTHVEPPKSDYLDRYLVGGAAGAETHEIAENEETADAATVPAENNRLYLLSGAFLVLILVAVVLVLTLPRDSQPEVSQVREPLISQAPEASRAGGEEGEQARFMPQQEDGQRSSGDESDGPKTEQNAGPPDRGAEDDGRGSGQAGTSPAQDPPDATTDRPSPATTDSAPAEPEAAPNPPPPESAAASFPPASAPAEAPIEDRATAAPTDGPVGRDDPVVVMKDGGVSISSEDDDKVTIRRSKGGIEIRANGTEDEAPDRP